MDTLNLNFNGKDNIIKSLLWIASVISWFLFMISGWLSINTIKEEFILFTIGRMELWTEAITSITAGKVYPLELYEDFIYIIDIVLLIFGTIAFFVFIIKCTCKKDGLFEKMFDQYTRFHFIPILLLAVLYFIGESKTPSNWGAREKPAHIWGLIVDIFALASMIFIYLKTESRGTWLDASIKKGLYSCIISIEWYYLFYDITYFPYNSKVNTIPTVKTLGIIWNIVVGLGILGFSLVFRDLVMALYNFIIYLGLALYYLSIDSSIRNLYNGAADGVIQIIMIVLSVLMALFLIIKYKENLLK